MAVRAARMQNGYAATVAAIMHPDDVVDEHMAGHTGQEPPGLGARGEHLEQVVADDRGREDDREAPDCFEQVPAREATLGKHVPRGDSRDPGDHRRRERDAQRKQERARNDIPVGDVAGHEVGDTEPEPKADQHDDRDDGSLLLACRASARCCAPASLAAVVLSAS